ncbi:MAG: response regulator [Bacteroidales bacterium]
MKFDLEGLERKFKELGCEAEDDEIKKEIIDDVIALRRKLFQYSKKRGKEIDCCDILKKFFPDDSFFQKLERNVEEIFEGIFRHLPVMFYIQDYSMRFRVVNNRLCSFFGLSKDEIIGRRPHDIVKYWNSNNYDSKFRYVLEQNTPVYGIKDSFVIENRPNWVVTNISPVSTDKDVILGAIGISWDLTEMKEQERNLKNSRLKAVEANEARGLFIAKLSHEVRTPVTNIVGMTEILLGTSLDSEQRDYLAAVSSSSKNLLNLVNDVLDFSKIESGNIRLHYESFDLRKVLNEVFYELRLFSESKGLFFEIDVDKQVPQEINGDSYRLKQVLLNLANNAIKFTEDGGVSIFVHLIKEESDSETIKLGFRVKDTGLGIADKDQEKVFSIFSQSNQLTWNQQYLGYGLGLPICKGLVELMNGSIFLQSELGKGSEFLFTIQARIVDSKCLINDSQQVQLPNKNTMDEKVNIKVLLVEDNFLNQRIISHHLSNSGIDFDACKNGVEGVDTFCSGKEYDLILMDVQMPLMDGFEATQKIRAFEVTKYGLPRVPIVALTANAMKGDKEKCISYGMSDYISKPFSGEELINIIKKNLIIRE